MSVHVAVPDRPCGNGCHTGHGAAKTPALCTGTARICDRCIDRLDTWLRQIPDTYALLPFVVEHGTVSTNPEMATTKRPDAPAPLRLEVMDLLDTRRGWSRYTDTAGRPLLSDNRRGAFGVVLDIASRVRAERRLKRVCNCGHARLPHAWRRPWSHMYADGSAVGPVERYCRAGQCACSRWQVTATMVGECGFLIQHLPWLVEQDWVADAYDQVKLLARELLDRVGEYRPHPVGMCVALVWNEALRTRLLCGGSLYRDKAGHGVHCASCGARTDPRRLTEIGRSIGLISDETQEASA